MFKILNIKIKNRKTILPLAILKGHLNYSLLNAVTNPSYLFMSFYYINTSPVEPPRGVPPNRETFYLQSTLFQAISNVSTAAHPISKVPPSREVTANTPISDREMESVETNSYSLLFQYAKKGDLKAIEELFEKGLVTDINFQDEEGYTALHYAAGFGCLELVKNLIDVHGADAFGKMTLVARFGLRFGQWQYLINLSIAYAVICLLAYHFKELSYLFLLITLPSGIKVYFNLKKAHTLKDHLRLLSQVSRFLVIFTILLISGIVIHSFK